MQEEILFLSHPEAMVSVLLTTEIQGDEAILIEGVERIIDYSGYKNTFKCDGLVKRKKIINFVVRYIASKLVYRCLRLCY